MNPWIDGLQTAYNVNSQGNINLEFEFNSVKKGKQTKWLKYIFEIFIILASK